MKTASTKFARSNLFFFLMLILFLASTVKIDRIFFKRNSSFSIHFLFSSLPNRSEWDLPPPSHDELQKLDSALTQKFHYLGKGAHCYAFVSEDEQYVIKFHRFASHMRIFPWLNHPFSYRFNAERKKIKEYNLQKLSYNLQNYKNSYSDLKEETGLIFLHINKTDTLDRTVTLIDKTQAEYQIPLDKVTFILQHKANLIYPTLDQLVAEKKIPEAKKVVTSIIHLIAQCCQKGYVDDDPVLRKNYGLLSDRAIHIDVGDLIKNETVKEQSQTLAHVKEMTESLRIRLENQYPDLLEHYNEEIKKMSTF